MSQKPAYDSLRRLVEPHKNEIMVADYNDLLGALKVSLRKPTSRRAGQDHWRDKLEASMQRVKKRDAAVPDFSFPPELPISGKSGLIIETIRKNQVVVITGETGSGKTTQIPKMCLAAGQGRRGIIGLTQPRRIAAVTIAERIAWEMGQICGRAVAYKTRFEEKTSGEPLIKVMTDGILLAETQRDRKWLDYDTIILDEAHERSLNIDLILGYLRTLLPVRKDLKLIITSATIDTDRFSQAFGSAPVISVSGRVYPVTVRYRPIDAKREEKGETTYIEEALSSVEELERNRHTGDILIFMPTENDIRETCRQLDRRASGLVLPLFARLAGASQRLVFAPSDKQKIIVATNIAETSLTIPGITCVIDTGLARILEYNPRSQTTGLPVVPVSQSSADQRKGRAGRVQDGICIRLYSEEDYSGRPVYTPPEILRSNLAGVILRLLSLNLGDIDSFPFIEKPQPKNIRDGIELLQDLGAIRRNERTTGRQVYELTPTGRAMALFPLDPRVSRMILEAKKEGCLHEVAVIAAALGIQDPRERPYDKVELAEAAHAVFQHPESDFLTYLQIWNRYAGTFEKKLSQGSLRKFCREHFLSYRRMMEWRDIYLQILNIADIRLPGKKSTGFSQIEIDQLVADKIHRSILSGCLTGIARKKEKNFYTAAKSREVMLYPGSGLFNRGGPWIVAAEISRTSRLFARNAANIKSEWLEELGGDHCRYSYSAPRWEKSRGEVVATEKVTLFGLTIIEGRTVGYAKIDPEEAKNIFIRDALVTGETGRKFPFVEHNLSLWDEARSMEERLRKRGIAIDEEMLASLYDQRLPLISDVRSLARLIKDRGTDEFLRFGPEDFVATAPDVDDLAGHPEQIKIGTAVLECNYLFEPGSPEDGVTIRMPVGLLSKAASENMERQLPSLMEEKILQMLKGLPKKARQILPPPVQIAREFIARQTDDNIPLPAALSRFLSERYKLNVPADAWALEKLPAHLNIRYLVTDELGKEIKSGRDIALLEKELAGRREQESMEQYRLSWEKVNVTGWDFGPLPEVIEMTGKHGVTGMAYPALADENTGVSLRLFTRPGEAARYHQEGVAALYRIRFADKLKQLKKYTALGGEMKVWAEALGSAREVERSVAQRVSDDLFCRPFRTPGEFDTHAATIEREILPYGQKVLTSMMPVMKSAAETYEVLKDLMMKNRANPPLTDFLRATLDEFHRLVPVNFIQLYSFERLTNLPRYLKALAIRAERGCLNLPAARDKLRDAEVYTRKLQEFIDADSDSVSMEKRGKIEELKWMIEEYKVSLFAQELKTPYPVSSKRLGRLVQEIENIVY